MWNKYIKEVEKKLAKLRMCRGAINLLVGMIRGRWL